MVELGSERQAVAHQIKEMRSLEKSDSYKKEDWDRGMEEYLYWLNGVSYLFQHARELRYNGLVLDIGAGLTKGISQISKSRLGEGLCFEATTLSFRPEIEQNLGLDKTHITPVEILKGVESSSVSVVLAVNSLAYSAAPQQALERINDVLVPGGVLKATFKVKEGELDTSPGPYNYQTHDKFSQALRDLNYDVAVSDLVSEEIMVAIKPGRPNTILASDLLRRDSGVIDILMKHEGHY